VTVLFNSVCMCGYVHAAVCVR